MVNWTKESRDRENTYMNDGKFDLPTPDTTHECYGFMQQVQNILGIFDGYDIEDEHDYHIENMADLVRSQGPRSIEDPSEEWINSYKMWLFADEVIQTCMSGASDINHEKFLVSVCLDYLEKLQTYYVDELGGDPDEFSDLCVH